MENNHETMQETVLRKIHTHELSMRPRFYFTLQIVALVVLALAILSISIFILNFILFSIRINQQDVFLGFGPRGVLAFLFFFPWLPLLLDGVLVLGLQKLLRQFRFGYNIPVLYLLGGIITLTLVVGFLVDRTSGINERLLHRSYEHILPIFFDGLYGGARHPLPPGSGVCRCTIVALSQNTLTVQDSRSSTTLTVILPPDDPRATTTSLHVGDTVFIAGDENNGMIQAFGVRKVPPTGFEVNPR